MKTNLQSACLRMCVMLLSCLACGLAKANDGVFMVNGSQLMPLQETDVAIAKEVLTITLCDDSTARVDVLYELVNRGPAKTVDVGFVAHAPYDAAEYKINPSCHPFIEDFTVVLNEASLPVNCYITAYNDRKTVDFKPLDMSQWQRYFDLPDEVREKRDAPIYAEALYNAARDSITDYAYVYCFKAHFCEGRNVIHHTYSYVMSYSVGSIFEVPYTLTPAMKWANHQIDDFTLRIKTKNTAKHFVVSRAAFPNGDFTVTEGTGKVRTVRGPWAEDAPFEEIALRNGTVEWHCTNYRTTQNMQIVSADMLIYPMVVEGTYLAGAFYDRTTGGPMDVSMDDAKTDGLDIKRIKRNLPYANRGYVFRDKQLQAYFNKLFWYMPDPQWQMSTDDFTQAEWELVKGK